MHAIAASNVDQVDGSVDDANIPVAALYGGFVHFDFRFRFPSPSKYFQRQTTHCGSALRDAGILAASTPIAPAGPQLVTILDLEVLNELTYSFRRYLAAPANLQ
jgi:hypothetical protein